MYKKKISGWAKHLDFILLDIVAIELALFVAYGIKFGSVLFFSTAKHFFLYETLTKVIPIVDLIIVFFVEPYTGIMRRNKYQELTKTISHILLVLAGNLLFMYMNQTSYYYSRAVLGLFALFSVLFTYGFRVLWKRVIRKRKLKDVNKRVMIVVASHDAVKMCLEELAHNNLYADYVVQGVVVTDMDLVGQSIEGVPVIAKGNDFLDYCRTNIVDEAYIDSNGRDASEKLAASLVELGVTVHINLLHSAQLMMPNRLIENYGDYVVLTSSMHIASNRQLIVKRLMDVVGSLVGMVFCIIAFIIFAPIILITSPGPIFFKQTRIGLNGRRFKIYKFRTMYRDAEKRKAELMAQNELKGNIFKMENDPRITPIGRFMRKFSIDELPQFFNILKGDMSLVGTRPPTEDEYENYAFHHKARLAIKPGLTGMWQVSGRNKIIDFEEVVALDTKYISNWSLGLDVQILLKTVVVVFTARGAS